MQEKDREDWMKQRENVIKRVVNLAGMLAFGVVSMSGMTAWAASKPSAPKPAARPSAPSRPSASSKPAGGAAKPGGSNSSKPSTPNANHPGANHPNANHSEANHLNTQNPGNRPGGGPGGRGGTQPSSSKISRPVPSGARDHVAKDGSAVRTRANGRVSDVHDARHNMDIHHGLDGGRHVEARRADGSRLVADRGRRGFVERGYHYHGHDFARRSYYWHGHEYGRFYRGYSYGGVYLNVYAPGAFFAPAFYGWAYNPWAVAVAYSGWGWGGTPWFGFYGGFFSPWAVYPGPAFWLTDYLVAANLEAAYAASQAVASDAPSSPMPPLINQQEGGPGPANEHNISTWSWNGSQFEMNFNGHCGNLTVERWDDQGVVLRRADFNGFKALYRGRFVAPGKLVGSVDWNPGGPPHMGTWSASFPPDSVPQAAGTSLAGATPLSEDVKQQIAAEVKAQIALENQEATQTAANQDVDPGSSGVARMLQDGHTHVFVVGTGLDVTNSSGQECAISDGDTLQLRTPPAAGATSADLVVLASKGGKECASGGTVTVGVSDLQEMQNHLRETIDQGLQEMQSKAGKGGIPAAPASAQAAPKPSPYAEVAPPPNPQDEKDLQAQAQQADTSESEVAKEASTDSGTPIAASSTPAAAADQPAKPAVTVALGQTTDQVKAILGNPLKTADLGVKTIYYYDGMKVVFKGGKVSDVE